MVSIIVPVYNEGATIIACLDSLSEQTYSDCEIIVVDDGSKESSKFNPPVGGQSSKLNTVKYYYQDHKGAGPARNLGASYAEGKILVFVDADMTFDLDFIKKLVAPIENGKTKGTFTKEEYVSNWNNPWARAWNYYQGLKSKRKIPDNFPSESPVFRAILKSEFVKAEGFSDIGFTDDWTLSRKLGYQAAEAEGAVCYHHNPDSWSDVYSQARWIGKNEFISGSAVRKWFNLIRYSLPIQLTRGIILSVRYRELYLIPFSVIYANAITVSIILSVMGEKKSK